MDIRRSGMKDLTGYVYTFVALIWGKGNPRIRTKRLTSGKAGG